MTVMILESNQVREKESEIKNKPAPLCVVNWSKKLFAVAIKNCCKKCDMCCEKTLEIYKVINDITEGKGRVEDIKLLKQLSCVIKDNAKCQSSHKAAICLLATIEKYPIEWKVHIERKRCPAMVCKKYISFHVLPNVCKGCTACIASCPEGAIMGRKGMIHVINQQKCKSCGTCIAACEVNAIHKAGAIKPKTPELPMVIGTFRPSSGKYRRHH